MPVKKILVKGPALSQSGYGEQTRFALKALRKYPELFDIYLINTTWGRTGWIWEDNEERQWIDNLLQKTLFFSQSGGVFDTSLQVLTPIEWQILAPENIGYTAGIETTKIAPEWINPSQSMNRIIVTSNHAKYGLENTSYPAKDREGNDVLAKITKPIHVVNYAVRKTEPDESFNIELPCEENFLVVAQWSPRKNLEQTIKSFVEEFIDKEVGLVVKTSTACNAVMDRQFTSEMMKTLLQDYPDRKCKVVLLHGDVTDQEMCALYRNPKIKALISLAHGEGFGLPIFEAVCNGLPVIAPDWGGQNDFIHMEQNRKKNGKSVKKTVPMIQTVDYEIRQVQPEAVWQGFIVPDSSWCYPKDFRYKARLRECLKNQSMLRNQAKKLQQHVLETFTEERQYRLFAEAVLGTSIEEAKTSYDVLDASSFINNETPFSEVVSYE